MACDTQFDMELFKEWLGQQLVNATKHPTDKSVVRDFLYGELRDENIIDREVSSVDDVLGDVLDESGIFKGSIILKNAPLPVKHAFLDAMKQNGWFGMLGRVHDDIVGIGISVGKPLIVLIDG